MFSKERERRELEIQSNLPPTHFPEEFCTKRHATAPAWLLARPQAERSRLYLKESPRELTESPEIETPESRAPCAFGLPPYVQDSAPNGTWSAAVGAAAGVVVVADAGVVFMVEDEEVVPVVVVADVVVVFWVCAAGFAELAEEAGVDLVAAVFVWVVVVAGFSLQSSLSESELSQPDANASASVAANVGSMRETA